MSDWLKIGYEGIESQQAFSGQLQSTEQPSPYEIPVAFRASIDKHSNRISIEFKYLDRGEPEFSLQPNQGVTLVLGQNSRRILGVKIYCEHPEDQYILGQTLGSDAVRNAFRRIRKDSESLLEKENYEMTGRIIDTQRQRILGELLAS